MVRSPGARARGAEKASRVDALGHENAPSCRTSRWGMTCISPSMPVFQKTAEELLGEESGAIVALDPTNGDILAMASRPGIRSQRVVERIDE